MTPETPPTARAPEPVDAPGTDLTRAYVRVIALQLVSLAGLWLLQSCYGG